MNQKSFDYLKVVFQKIGIKLKEDFLVKSSSAFFLKIIGSILAYFFTILITRNFGAEIWGQFTISNSVIVFGFTVSSAGISRAIIRYASTLNAKENNKSLIDLLTKIILFLFITSLVFSTAVYFLAEFVSEFLSESRNLVKPIKLISFVIPAYTVIEFLLQYLRGIQLIKIFSFFDYISKYSILIVLIVVLLPFYKSQNIIYYSYLFTNYLVLFLLIIFIIKIEKKKHSKSGIKFNEILKYSVPLYFSEIIKYANASFIILVIAKFLSESEVGIYNVSTRVSSALNVIFYPLTTVAMPKFGELIALRKTSEIQEIMTSISKIMMILSIPAFLIIVFFGKTILSLFGNEFISGYPYLLILFLSSFINIYSGGAGYILQVADEQRTYRNLVTIVAVFNLTLVLILTNYFSLWGATITSLISNFLWVILLSNFIKKRLGLKVFYNPFDMLK